MNEPPLLRASSFPDVALDLGAADYPPELADLEDDAPRRLYARGTLALLDVRPRVAIVGTRKATEYGLRVTRELTAAFVRAGASIVSGLATGIDGMAHRTALQEGGVTIAVLGTGLNGVYPKAHRQLQRTIGERGLLLSELEHDDHGMPFSFLHRNRIIAALSSVVIIVEAPRQSGALGTAKHAMDLNREVAAVPGSIDKPQSVGANHLIQLGAHILTCIEDALALARLTPPPRTPQVPREADEGRVWAALVGGGLDIDSLCHLAGLPAAQCLAAVTRLELAGSVECSMTGEIRRR